MDKKCFIEQMNYLNLYYLNFKFDTTNPALLKMWYERLSSISNEKFEVIVDSYASNHKYPPQSPTDLLDEIKNIYLKVEMKPDEAWNYVLGIVSTNSLTYYPEKVIQKLEQYPMIKKVFDDMFFKFYNLKANETEAVGKLFKSKYQQELNNYLEQKQNQILLPSQEKLQIEG